MTAETPAPVPSGVDDLRDRIATAMHHAQCGCDQWTAHEGEDGDPTYNLMADAVLAVVGPELARRDAEIKRLSADVHQKSEIGFKVLAEKCALRTERDRLSDALRRMASRVTEQKREARDWYRQWYDTYQFACYAPVEALVVHRKRISDSFFNQTARPGIPQPSEIYDEQGRLSPEMARAARDTELGQLRAERGEST